MQQKDKINPKHTFKFGFSLAHGPDLSLPELSQLPGERGLCGEIPGRLLEMKKALPLLRRKGWTSFNINEIISANVTRGIAIHKENIIRDFKREFFRMLKNANAPIDCVIMDFGLDDAMHDADLDLALTRLLQGMALDLHLAGIRLAFPVRIPSWNDGIAEFCLAFRNRLMLPQLCFSVDIHPHEMAGEDYDPAQLLRWLKFDLGAVRFFYEPETGNHLVPKALEPWLNVIAKTSFSGQITFCPRCKSSETLIHEMGATRELISQLP